MVRLREAGLKLKPSKCFIARKEVKYLGYVISTKGVNTDPENLEAVPIPTSVKQLRSFIRGLSPAMLNWFNHCTDRQERMNGPLTVNKHLNS